MRLLIDDKDLELLLEKKRAYIGKDVTVDTVIAGVSFLLSVFTATYTSFLGLPGIVLQTIFAVIGIAYMAKIVFDLWKAYTQNYHHTDLLKDIEHLNQIEHNHSLVVIKKRDKFLLYYDERWDCKLFLNYKTQERNNEASITERVAADLNLDRDSLQCTYVSSRVQEKYSVSHQENRVYNHRLYEISIENLPKDLKEPDFKIGNKHYYWMTMQEMEKDENIQKKNLEVLDFVKESIIV